MLWFVSPAWRRYDVTRLALAQRAHLCGELAERGIEANCVIVADDENLDIAREFGFATVERDNVYLGRRFNDGYEYACREGAQYVVHIGSDDWMHVDLFDRLPLAHPEPPVPTQENPTVTWGDGPEMLTGREITLVDLEHGRMRRVLARGRHGAIPWILPRRAFEENGYRPVKETALEGIDGLLAGHVQPELVFSDPHEHCRVDFKTAFNMNGYEKITRAGGYGPISLDPWRALRKWYPEDLVAQAERLSYEIRHCMAAA